MKKTEKLSEKRKINKKINQKINLKINLHFKSALPIILMVIVLASALNVNGAPNLPTEFYGEAHSFNTKVLPGTSIKAYDEQGNLCGTFIVSKTGYYGVLTCNSKESNGTGPENGDNITFRIGTNLATALTGTTADTIVTPTFLSGDFKKINLVSPSLICGDNYCDKYESCGTCALDCGTCPPTGGGGTGGEGGGGGGGGGSGGTGGALPENVPATGTLPPETPEEECEESWSCADWSECHKNGTRTRECVDVNGCGTNDTKPATKEFCLYTDLPFPFNETSQKPATPRKEEPLLIEACKERMPFFSTPSLIFLFLFLIICAGALGRLHRKIKKIKTNQELNETSKLYKEFHLRKETYIFIIIMSVMTFIVYVYHYFFFQCKDKYLNYLWLLGLFILVSPIIINFIIELMKYREHEKLANLAMLNDTHYQHLKNLLKITNNHLLEIENKIVTKLSELDSSDDFQAIITNIPELEAIYKDISKLSTLYKDEKEKRTIDNSAVKIEKDLISGMDSLKNNDSFNDAAKLHPELAELKDQIFLLYEAYNSKQELYTEIYRIEQDYYENIESDKNNSSERSSKK